MKVGKGNQVEQKINEMNMTQLISMNCLLFHYTKLSISSTVSIKYLCQACNFLHFLQMKLD